MRSDVFASTLGGDIERVADSGNDDDDDSDDDDGGGDDSVGKWSDECASVVDCTRGNIVVAVVAIATRFGASIAIVRDEVVDVVDVTDAFCVSVAVVVVV